MGFKLKFSHQFIIVWLSLAAFLHNILMNGANNVIISSLQKEFYLSSRETGVWVSVYDIGSLLSSVLISFASARGSKPRWIAFGMCMLFCGCMITVVPHFIRAAPSGNDLEASDSQPVTSSSDNIIEMCDYTLIINDQNSSSTKKFLRHRADPADKLDEKQTTNNVAQASSWLPFQPKYLLYAANMINGLSSASMTTITFSYIEDMAPHHLSGIYEGIYYAVGAFGVGVGFMVTSKCLTLYTYLDRGLQLPSWLTTKHPNWIGAWWLPFLIFGFVALLQASVIFIFPRKLQHKSDEKHNHHSSDSTSAGKSNGHVMALKQDNEMKDMSSGATNVPTIEISDYEEKSDESESESVDDDDGEKSKHMNTLISTLKQTGSLLSINQLGLKTSRQSLNEDNENDVKKKFIENGIHSNGNGHVVKEADTSLSLIQKSILLLKKPVYLFLITAGAIEGLLQNSFLAFASLFLEYQYRLASGSASLILGFLSIPPLMIGGLLSGIIVRKLEGKTSSCLKFLAVLLFVNIFVYAGFIIYCQEPTLINSPIQNDHSAYHTSDNCNCNAKIFKPVCLEGSNDTVFRSSCSAGCTEYDSKSEQYFNCTQAPLTYLLPPQNSSSVKYVNYFTNGLCPTTDACTPRLIVSYASIALLMFLNALAFLPYLKVTIGCIDAQDMNSIGLGIKQFFMNAFGTIPGPILFGTVIDATCTFWHKDVNNQSVCKMYNNRQFALGFGLLGIGFKTICFFLIIISLIFINRQKKK